MCFLFKIDRWVVGYLSSPVFFITVIRFEHVHVESLRGFSPFPFPRCLHAHICVLLTEEGWSNRPSQKLILVQLLRTKMLVFRSVWDMQGIIIPLKSITESSLLGLILWVITWKTPQIFLLRCGYGSPKPTHYRFRGERPTRYRQQDMVTFTHSESRFSDHVEVEPAQDDTKKKIHVTWEDVSGHSRLRLVRV